LGNPAKIVVEVPPPLLPGLAAGAMHPQLASLLPIFDQTVSFEKDF